MGYTSEKVFVYRNINGDVQGKLAVESSSTAVTVSRAVLNISFKAGQAQLVTAALPTAAAAGLAVLLGLRSLCRLQRVCGCQ